MMSACCPGGSCSSGGSFGPGGYCVPGGPGRSCVPGAPAPFFNFLTQNGDLGGGEWETYHSFMPVDCMRSSGHDKGLWMFFGQFWNLPCKMH